MWNLSGVMKKLISLWLMELKDKCTLNVNNKAYV